LGVIILLISLIGFIFYTYLLLFSGYDILVLKFTLLFFVAAIVGVIAWMGYTMATAASLESTEEEKQTGNNP
jgi:threonine/homoserine/homoserine lactone efflux protein